MRRLLREARSAAVLELTFSSRQPAVKMRRKAAILAAFAYILAGLPFAPAAAEETGRNICLVVHDHHRASQNEAPATDSRGNSPTNPHEQLCCHLGDMSQPFEIFRPALISAPLPVDSDPAAYNRPFPAAVFYPIPVPPG